MRSNEFTVLSDAIAQPLGRDEYINHKIAYFAKAPVVHTINNLELRKYVSADATEIYYGLIDTQKNPIVLAGILQLEKIKPGWQVRLTQMENPYKSQGYASFVYDYAVMNDGLTLLSDTSQTEGDLGGSRGLWEKLYRQGRFTVGGYNLQTDEFIPLDHYGNVSDRIYNQKEDVVWIAMPRQSQETINEMLTRLNNNNKYRHIEWYGSGIYDS